MTVINTLKNHGKAMLRSIGFELRRIQPEQVPAPLCEDPLEVVRQIYSHEPAALNCPLNLCVAFNGMSFSKQGWHPFVQTAKDYVESGVRGYHGSHLEKYYKSWQPKNAREALIGATLGPFLFDNQPSFLKHLPWSYRSVQERAAYMRRIIQIENAEFGNIRLNPSDGYGLHGPVTSEKAKLEYERIVAAVDSIRERGFDRWSGDITVDVLRRGSQIRYLISHGHHRAGAMVALGHGSIPAKPEVIIDEKYLDHWPGVYQKIWTREEARAYFDHLFDFSSIDWAKERELL